MRAHLSRSSSVVELLGTGLMSGVLTREWKSSVKPSREGGRGRGDEVVLRDMVRRWWIVPRVWDSFEAVES
jgi:hypothetical protein